MMINKFQGKTKEEAIELAKQEFGSNVVIMNVKEIKPKGLFRAFMSPTYEVTAAMEDRDTYASPHQTMATAKKLHENINVAADEEIPLPTPVRTSEYDRMAAQQETRPQMQAAERPKTQSGFSAAELEKGQALSQAVAARHTQTADAGATQRQYRRGEATMAKAADVRRYVPEKFAKEEHLEKRLEDLSNRLEEKLGTVPKEEAEESRGSEELNFVRILYRTLLKNEVQETYVNQIIEEIEKFIRPGNSVDMILANVYQKLILRFGRPNIIEMSSKKPKVVFFIGPTGVGKTTTIAKIASKYKVEKDKKVAFITADTYRIAATEQLRVYANILDVPMSIVYSAEELNQAVAELTDCDLVFVDTAGFSHKNEEQRDDTKKLLQGIDSEYPKEVYLVLSATTKYQDLQAIVDVYRQISDYKIIFTKLDETAGYGNILNIKLYSGADLSYVTNGQNVPEDIEIFKPQEIVKQLLGGK